MSQDTTEIGHEQMLAAIAAIRTTVGADWLKAEHAKAKAVIEKNQAEVWNRKHNYLFNVPGHPLIEMWLALERWLAQAKITGIGQADEALLRIHALGDAISRTKQFPGFDTVARKLTDKRRFRAAAFEIEVAAAYQNAGNAVEFIPECEVKTPDLKVTTPKNSIFWVECKNREVQSQPAVESNRIGEEIYKQIIRQLGPAKSNCAISVIAIDEISWSDVDSIVKAIVEVSLQPEIERNVGDGSVTFQMGLGGRFQIRIKKLAAADEKEIADGMAVSWQHGMSCFAGFEGVLTESGQTVLSNPHYFSFKNSTVRDYVSGSVNAFKNATKQLPVSGPGVVWIRIPDSPHTKEMYDKFVQTEARVRAELAGDSNRRVNKVVLLTRFFERVSENGRNGILYRVGRRDVNHPNPKVTIDDAA